MLMEAHGTLVIELMKGSTTDPMSLSTSHKSTLAEDAETNIFRSESDAHAIGHVRKND